MSRKLFAAAAFALACGVVVAADDEKKPDEKKPGSRLENFDKGKLFAKMDANADGKVTKEEWTKFFESMGQKLADSGKGGGKVTPEKLGQAAAKGFDAIDTEKKGSITKEQFEKSEGLLGALRPKKKD